MLHPEIKQAVYKEYSRLTLKFPQVSDAIRMKLAKVFVRDMAIADSSLFMKEYVNVE